MSAYPASVAEVRAARAARDAARERLYALQLRSLELDRALRRAARGDGAEDPSRTRGLAALRAQEAALLARLDADAAQLTELAGLPDRLEAAKQQVAAAEARSAELAREAVALGGAVAQRAPGAADRLRAVQQERAAVEHAAEPLRSEVGALAAGQDEAEKQTAALEQDATDGRAALDRVREEIDDAQKEQPDLAAAKKESDAALAAQRAELTKLEERVVSAIGVLTGEQPPQRLIACVGRRPAHPAASPAGRDALEDRRQRAAALGACVPRRRRGRHSREGPDGRGGDRGSDVLDAASGGDDR